MKLSEMQNELESLFDEKLELIDSIDSIKDQIREYYQCNLDDKYNRAWYKGCNYAREKLKTKLAKTNSRVDFLSRAIKIKMHESRLSVLMSVVGGICNESDYALIHEEMESRLGVTVYNNDN